MDNDVYNLDRFISAQEEIYESVLAELQNGEKRSHWMWFIFPQIDGLGFSATTKYYSIKNKEEARHYLNHQVLGPRLLQCAELLLAIEDKPVTEIFDFPDDKKLKSSMTLFASVSDPDSVFAHVLEKYFDGERDERTTSLLDNSSP